MQLIIVGFQPPFLTLVNGGTHILQPEILNSVCLVSLSTENLSNAEMKNGGVPLQCFAKKKETRNGHFLRYLGAGEGDKSCFFSYGLFH